jgi:ABC-type transport system involved in cytochrome c biogenesis permease subunit
METCLQSQATFLPLIYLLATTAYGVAFFHEEDVGVSRKVATPLLLVALVLHATYLVMMTIHSAHPPLTSAWEFLVTLGFGIALVYLVLERATGTKATGIVVLPLVTLLVALSSAFVRHGRPVPEILRTPWFTAHAGTMVLGFGAFALAFTFGALWTLLYRNIKASRFGVVYDRLPPLAVLFRMQLHALVLGWLALTVSILVGFLWASHALPGFHRDPKVIVTLVIWALYGVGLGVRWFGGRRETWLTYVSLGGFLLLLIGLFAAATLFPSRHAFL